MGKDTVLDKLYKTLTKDKLNDLLVNLEKCNIALAHLTYMISEANTGSTMQVPLIAHPDKVFHFAVMKHKVNQDEVLVISIEDKEVTSNLH